MKLYEFEGHRILNKVGIKSPFFVVCENISEIKEARKRIKFPIVIKVQVLQGRRGKGGGIKIVNSEKQLMDNAGKMFGSSFGAEGIVYLGLFEKVAIEKEYYASITYDSQHKVPFLLFSQEGGVEIEEVKKQRGEVIQRMDIDPINGPKFKDIKKIVTSSELADFVMRMWDAFWRYDLRLVEVNPIAKCGDDYMAVDAKVIVDDSAFLRHRDLDILPKGAISAIATKREIEAKKIDAEDYRGSAGSTFIELDGDIAVLASGGGASLLVMDAIYDNGGRAANYTEYSGNPPREKVEKLTKVTLSRDGLNGCLVAGAVANFTDIYETLVGFSDGILGIKPKPDYPIVIRRGGPRQKEAYTFLEKFSKKEGFDIHLFGPEIPISVACDMIVKLSKQYKEKTNGNTG